VVAGVTALVTVFYALVNVDLKVALAYHSVENIGIILAGLGLAVLFSDRRFSDNPAIRGAAAVALLACLYHVVNHALFKSLLFLGTGSIERHVGPPDLRRLGGLITRYRWTAITFLIGATAIAGLPPLNGFISEWLTVQSLFGGRGVYKANQPSEPVVLLVMVVLVITLATLAMAFAMTALAFAKITGEALLGEPREPRHITRQPWSMRLVMLVLASACLVLGLQPWLLVPWLSSATTAVGYHPSSLSATPTVLAIQLPGSPTGEGYDAALPLIPLMLLVAIPVVLTVGLRPWKWRTRKVWVGGEPFSAKTMQYDGSALSALVWEPLSKRRPERADEAPAVPAAAVTEAEPPIMTPNPLPVDVVLSSRRVVLERSNQAYNALIAAVIKASDSFGKRVQSGDVRRYLVYILATVILALVFLAVAR
jgi:hydrogenase-4 component B